jgi:hypothetical protein
MTKFVYKADNAWGNESMGTVLARTAADARQILREKGLISTYLEDSKTYKEKRRKRKKRQKILITVGVVLVSTAGAASTWMNLRPDKEVAPVVADMKESGVIRSSGGTVVAGNKEEEAFAHRIVEAWNSYSLGLVTGIELRKNIMALYVTPKATRLEGSDLQSLSTTSIKALQREFKASAVTMLLIQDDTTVMELYYNSITKKTKIQDHRKKALF